VAPDPASPADVNAAIAAGAVGVVAYGSNASPVVLRRKLGERAAAAVLATPVVLADTDVVFSAHVSRHGAIPATIVPWPGAEVDAWLLAVPAGAIDALDATEPNYVREDLDPARHAHPRAGARCARSRRRRCWSRSASGSRRTSRRTSSCWRRSETRASAPRAPRRCAGACREP
jgi:hypothetical protein